MDKKDEIIIQQLELIKTMTENNLRRMADDIWGPAGAPKTDNKPPRLRTKSRRRKPSLRSPRRP